MIAIINLISQWAIPFILIAIPTLGLAKKIPVYESFVKGAKEGFSTVVRMIPFLVAMFIAIRVFQRSGAMELLVHFLKPLTSFFNIPPEVLPLALIRPLSGSGAFGLLGDLLVTHGPDSFIGRLVSTVQGSTETTFYVLTVYFGAIGIREIKHSLLSSLAADIAGFIASVYIVYRIFGG